jgi:hypothetical protein
MEKGEKVYGTRVKPFWLEEGTYGYYSSLPELEKINEAKTIASGTVLIANWVAAFSVDKVDALLLLPLGVLLNRFLGDYNWLFFDKTLTHPATGKPWTFAEKSAALLESRNKAHGFSGIFNVIAGYLAYQVVFNKSARRVMPILGASATMFSNIMAQIREDSRSPINHYAHYGGYTMGVLFAFLLSFLKRSTNGLAFLVKYDKPISAFFVSILIYYQVTRESLPPQVQVPFVIQS